MEIIIKKEILNLRMVNGSIKKENGGEAVFLVRL
jgi:hypothetical protein